MAFDYDLFVIGAGSGGLAAAKRAASYGARVALAEADLVGGTCVVRGCVPKKLMVYASHFSHAYTDAIGFGWEAVIPKFDWQRLISAIDRETRRLSALHITLLDKSGVELIQGRATLVDPQTIAVGEKKFTAQRILIAVGSEAVCASIPGVEHTLTSREMFKLAEQPKRLAIVGGGYIGTEFAGIMNGLGSEVTVIIRQDLILMGFDEDIRKHVQMGMTQHGVKFLTNTIVEKIEKTPDGLQLFLFADQPASIKVDAVLFAIGRKPNLAGLGLDNAGVETSKGAIAVNEFSQTSQPHIFAVGDCTNRVNLTPVAIVEGRAFADSEFGRLPYVVSYENIPTAVFAQPEVGSVGMTEAKAKQMLGENNVIVYRSRFRPLFYNLADIDEKTLMKLVVDRESDRILGAHMIGKDAAEIIQMAAIPIKMGATKKDFDNTMALHPTTAEEFVTMR